jgi:multidrug efflux pump subunit AcrB
MKRQVSLTANISGEDLGRVAREVTSAITAIGDPPKGSTIEVRGQIPPMQEMLRGLAIGLGLAVVVIFLLLSANFQSWKMALVTISTAPAVIAGVVLVLGLTRTTLNIQSFMGAIMAIGVAMANGILLVTFAENHRRTLLSRDPKGSAGARRASIAAAVEAGSRRMRPILMTSAAMIAGMLPMAIGLGEGGEQSAPLGRAVIGGLFASTIATLLIVPAVYSALAGRRPFRSPSLHPDDADSGPSASRPEGAPA